MIQKQKQNPSSQLEIEKNFLNLMEGISTSNRIHSKQCN